MRSFEGARAQQSCRAQRWWLLSLLCATACGGGAMAGKPPTVVRRVGDGPAIALVSALPADAKARQPVQLAMFIDAGSRDASAPLVAAIAAELLGERVGRQARARALPDGLEVIAVCDDGLARCAARLARALAQRAPSEAAIARARERLVSTARATLASDPERAADGLALRALFAEHAAAFLPLEASAGSGEKNLAAEVHRFIADAFGPGRTLIVASGPVDIAQLEDVVAQAFDGSARAAARRQARTLPESAASISIEVEVDNAAGLSIALAGEDLALVTRAAVQLREELLRSKRALSVIGHTSSVRGGALALLRARTASDDPAALVREASARIERLRAEGPSSAAALPVASDEPIAALRRAGARFIAGAPSASGSENASALIAGLGVTVRGARADHVGRADPDAPLRASERERLTRAMEAGKRLAAPELTGELSRERAIVALENGSHVAVELAPSDHVAIAIKLRTGAASDPPELHGRAALLAHAMTVACAGHGPAALRAQLASLGATLEPRASARSMGIVLRAKAEHARAAIALATECALAPSLARGDVTRARLMLRERLGLVPGAGRLPGAAGDLQAQVARMLSEQGAPGELAPFGASATIASVDEPELSELLGHALWGPGVAVAIAGGGLEAMGAEGAAELVARRLSELPSEAKREPSLVATATAQRPSPRRNSRNKSERTVEPPLPAQAVEALLVWSAPDCAGGLAEPAAQEAARAFAAAASLALATSELHTVWSDGDCAGGHAWAALLARGASDRIATVADSAASAVARLDARAIATAAGRAAQQRAAERGGLAEHAEALAEAALFGTDPAGSKTPTNGGGPKTLIDRLRSAPVRVLAVE